MQVGDIILVSGQSIVSKLIRKIVGSKWTHAAIYVGNGTIIEIDWNSKTELVKNYYPESDFEYVILRAKRPLEFWQRKKIIQTAIKFDRSGSRYDWFVLFGLLLKRKYPRIPYNLNSENDYICTELIDKIYQEAGIRLFPKNNGSIYPHEFMNNPYLEVVDEHLKIAK